MSRLIAISTFLHKRDNAPGFGEAPWDQVIAGLATPRAADCTTVDCKHSDCVAKNGWSWSPNKYKDGATRASDNVEYVSILVIDADHIKTDAELEAIIGRLQWLRFAIMASHSDRPGDRCVRILIDVTRNILASEFPRFLRAILEMLELPGDPQTKDTSRLFYLPSRPSDACGAAVDGTGYLFAHGDGKALDVDAVMSVVGDAPGYGDYSGPREIPDFAGAPSIENLEIAARALAAAWPSGGRNIAQLALAGALARVSWPAELIADFCACVAELQETGNGDYPKRLTAAKASISKARDGKNIQGWPSLLPIVGEPAVRAAREALGLNSAPRPNPAFTAAMGALAAQARTAEVKAAAELPPPPAPTGIDLDSVLKSAQKRLASRKDPEALRDAEYLKRISKGDFLTEDPNEDRKLALCHAALAVVRAAPRDTTPDQIQRKLLSSAGALACDLPQIIEAAQRAAVSMPSLFSRANADAKPDGVGALGVAGANLPLDEFVLAKTGPRAGMPDGRQHNCKTALRRLGVELLYNELSGREILSRDGRRVDLEDHHVSSLFLEIERNFDVQPTDTYFGKVINDVARKNSYHPVRDYLDSLPEDVEITDLLDTWLVRFAGAPDTPFVRAISRIVLVAAVRRVRSPGCKFDEMLILETPVQGRFKSSALKALAVDEDWFNDSFELNDDDKKMIEQTQGKWIIEAGELAGMTKGDHNKFKKWLSKTRDRARMSYDRRPTEVSRQFIVIGTTNDDQYLKDQTGNRRYWPVLVQEFDVAALKAARNQIWAEASRLERENPADEYIRLDPSLYAAAGVEQNKRRAQDSFEIVLNDMIGSLNGRIRIQEVWKLLGFHDDRLPQKGEPNAIAAALKLIGFEHSNTRSVRGIRGTYYERGEGAERDILLSVIGHVGGYKVKADAVMLGPSAPPALGVRPPANEAN